MPAEWLTWFAGIAIALAVVALLALVFGERALQALMRCRAALRKRLSQSDGP